jgi:two-component system OmpR family response regulator
MKMKQSSEITIFLVDDDTLFRKALEHQLLHALKYNVHIRSFSTGEDCMKQLAESPDIIILDYFLNGSRPDAMDGMQVLRKLKESLPDAIVLILSGQDKMEVAIDTLKNGAYDYIIKNDNALLKTQNLVRNVITTVSLNKKLKRYRFWMKAACVAALVLIATGLIALS